MLNYEHTHSWCQGRSIWRLVQARPGVGGVAVQRIADRADVAIGTLCLHAPTKAELLILVALDGIRRQLGRTS